jgi:hypothetical protein
VTRSGALVDAQALVVVAARGIQYCW